MTTVVVVVLVVLLLVAALRLWITANRLDRLHVRTEAAWSALEGALARRIVATRAVAAAGGLDHPQSDRAAPAGRRRRQRRPGRIAPTRRTTSSRALSTIPAAADARTGRRAWPTPANGWCWPAGSTTTRSGTPVRCAQCCSPGSSGWPAGRRCPTTSRSPSTRTAPYPITPDRGQGGAARRRRSGAAAVRHRPAGGFAVVDHPGWGRRDR